MKDKKILIIIVSLLILIIAVLVVRNVFLSYPKITLITGRDYAFTLDTSDSNNLPFINLKGETAKHINNEIASLYYQIINDSEENKFNYYFHVKDSLLSVVIYYQEVNNNFFKQYLIYNFNLDNGEIIPNEQFLEIFELDQKLIWDRFNDKIKNYYNQELLANTINSKISLNEYYELLNFNRYEMSYFLNQEGKITLYHPFQLTYYLLNESGLDDFYELVLNTD